MIPSEAKVGQLIRTEYGLVTIMKFFAPKYVGCVVVNKETRSLRADIKVGEWIYIQGYDFDKAEIICK
jgi:hypothetical protein